jgi:hypothetical protein
VGSATFDSVTVVTYDDAHDLAILEVPQAVLNPLPIVNNTTRREGQRVVVIGHPEGLSYSVSDGVISAERELDETYVEQLTAPISPGNSGGPVLDDRGRVIGVATAQSLEGQNLNFAVDVRHLSDLLRLAPEGQIPERAAARTSQLRNTSATASVTARSRDSTLDGVYAVSFRSNDGLKHATLYVESTDSGVALTFGPENGPKPDGAAMGRWSGVFPLRADFRDGTSIEVTASPAQNVFDGVVVRRVAGDSNLTPFTAIYTRPLMQTVTFGILWDCQHGEDMCLFDPEGRVPRAIGSVFWRENGAHSIAASTLPLVHKRIGSISEPFEASIGDSGSFSTRIGELLCSGKVTQWPALDLTCGGAGFVQLKGSIDIDILNVWSPLVRSVWVDRFRSDSDLWIGTAQLASASARQVTKAFLWKSLRHSFAKPDSEPFAWPAPIAPGRISPRALEMGYPLASSPTRLYWRKGAAWDSLVQPGRDTFPLGSTGLGLPSWTRAASGFVMSWVVPIPKSSITDRNMGMQCHRVYLDTAAKTLTSVLPDSAACEPLGWLESTRELMLNEGDSLLLVRLPDQTRRVLALPFHNTPDTTKPWQSMISTPSGELVYTLRPCFNPTGPQRHPFCTELPAEVWLWSLGDSPRRIAVDSGARLVSQLFTTRSGRLVYRTFDMFYDYDRTPQLPTIRYVDAWDSVLALPQQMGNPDNVRFIESEDGKTLAVVGQMAELLTLRVPPPGTPTHQPAIATSAAGNWWKRVRDWVSNIMRT